MKAFENISRIMNDKQFEMMYPYQDVCALRAFLVEVHENQVAVSCSKEHYQDYSNACKLFGVTPHPLQEIDQVSSELPLETLAKAPRTNASTAD